MSETTAPDAGEQGGNGTGKTPTGSGEFQPITSQDDLNKVIGERIKRERARFADYDQLKAAADELAQIKDSQRTEAERFAAKLADAISRAELAEQRALRSKIQASHGISDEDADLFLTGADEESLLRQAKALADRTPKVGTNYVPGEGRSPAASDSSDAVFAAQLFGGNSR